MAYKYPSDFAALIAHLKKLPGVGTRTAERFAFEFLTWPQEELAGLGTLFQNIRAKTPSCVECGAMTEAGDCFFCKKARNPNLLCIVSSARDVYAMEETRSFQGLYHVVEHLLSPLDGRNIETLNIEKIKTRISSHSIKEVILAFDSTLEGDATALYLKDCLEPLSVSISRLAFGLPVGSSLEYIDGGTLTRALKNRQSF